MFNSSFSSNISTSKDTPSTSISLGDVLSSSPSHRSSFSIHSSTPSVVQQSPPHSSESAGFIASYEIPSSPSSFPRDCYLTAEARINNVPGIVLLDTGSGVTIISSNHWKILGSADAIHPYDGPEIQGPDGSSIGPQGQVDVHISMAGITVQHTAILAKNFHHLILLGNDYMKSIGLVLDLQANKMWRRDRPEHTFSLSSNLSQAGRIDVPVISTEQRTIAPYHIAFLEVHVPQSLSSHSWDASITGRLSHVATANSLIRFIDRKSFVQVANCSPRQQHVHCGQHVALADLYSNDNDSLSDLFSLSLDSTLPSLSFPADSSMIPSTKSSFPLPLPSHCKKPTSSLEHHQSGSFTSRASSIVSPDVSANCCSISSFTPCSTPSLSSSIDLLPPSQSSLLSEIHQSPFSSEIEPIVSHSALANANSSIFAARNPSPSVEYDFLHSLDFTDTSLTNPEIDQLQNLLIKYRACFRTKSGRTNLTQHHIDTGNTKPIKLRPYRVSPQRQQIISQQINQMLGDGIIEHASGPYAAPITLQPKKDGSLRFCVDFRQLNSVTVRDVYPIPRIDETLDQLQMAKYFTSLDLKSGFWQIELDEESRPKTAFITHAGLFQFKVMPFGLTNAPATFQRLMDLVLGGLKWSCALVYLDDIIIYSPSFDSHLHHMESVLQRIQSSGLTLQISKCQFCKLKLRYLGHVVSQYGIEPDPEKIRAVRDYPIPVRLKDVRTFLGLTSYYRRFIKHYATIAEPLISLTRNAEHKPFLWTTACQDSFQHLRQLLIEAPIISYPRFDQPFLLQLDASDVGISAILAQKLIDPDGVQREHVIGYASRTLSQIERRYSPTERECLAIVYGCSHFRPYLEGLRFTILTDHRALKWLHQTKDLNSRLARWAMQIAAYDVDIQHRPGAANTNCDALSRAPLDSSSDSTTILPFEETTPIDIPNNCAQVLLLDYFHRSFLPPPNLPIPIPLVSDVDIVNNLSPPISPSTSSCSILLANLEFANNIQLYEELRSAQWQDPDLLPLLNYLQHRQLPDGNPSTKIVQLASFHRLVDGALFRITRSSSTSSDDQTTIIDFSTHPFLHRDQQLRLVVPKSKIRELLSLAHDHPTAAHLGRRKTLFRLSSRFTWPYMRRDVANYVRACPLCQQYKSSNQLPGGLMKPILVYEPWNTVGIDLTGPLPKTRRGHLYILVVIDYFTKWVELFPLSDTKAKTISQIFLDEVICRFGFPVRIISDNGVQFVSTIFTNVCQSLGIKHQRTPLYHPQSNLCERVNRTLKPLLAALAHHDHQSWDLKLPQIAFALRTAPSDSTDQSPAFLMFGRQPRHPLDFNLPPPPILDTTPTTDDISAYRQHLTTQLLPAYASTRELLDIARQRQTRQYNQHHRPLQFEPGDLVWVTELSGIAMGKWRGKKFSPRRVGPYRVVERVSSLIYTLVHTLTHQQLTPIHISRLQPYYSFTSFD